MPFGNFAAFFCRVAYGDLRELIPKKRQPREVPRAVGPGLLALAGLTANIPVTGGGCKEIRLVRVVVFVDGFNLHYGIKSRGGRKLLWLDLQALALSILRGGQVLVQVKYFTARFRDNPVLISAQSAYLEALESHCPLVTLIEGRFQEKRRVCSSCGAGWVDYEEKETDVSIATALLENAVQDRYDMALLLSADSDLCPAVAAAKRICPDKRIVAAFPPGRHSVDLQRAVDGFIAIGLSKIRQSQLPEAVTARDGVVLRRPTGWT
jgi:uncharacterized LabA/DUF88 family protein